MRISEREEEMNVLRSNDKALRLKLMRAETELANIRDQKHQILVTNNRQQEQTTTELDEMKDALMQSKVVDSKNKRQLLLLAESNKKLTVELNVCKESVVAAQEKLSIAERIQHQHLQNIQEHEQHITQLKTQVQEQDMEINVLQKQKNELTLKKLSSGSVNDVVSTMEDKLASITLSSQQEEQKQQAKIDEYKRGLLIAEKNKLVLVDKVVDALDGVVRNIDIMMKSKVLNGIEDINKENDDDADLNSTNKKRSYRLNSIEVNSKPQRAQRVSLNSTSKVFFSNNMPSVMLSKLNKLMDRVNAMSSALASLSNENKGLRYQLQRNQRQRYEDKRELDLKLKLVSKERDDMKMLLKDAKENIEESKQSINGLKNDSSKCKRQANISKNNATLLFQSMDAACTSLQQTLRENTSIEYFPSRPTTGESVASSLSSAGVNVSSVMDIESLTSCLHILVQHVCASLSDLKESNGSKEDVIQQTKSQIESLRDNLSGLSTENARLKEEVTNAVASVKEYEQKLESTKEKQEKKLAEVRSHSESERAEMQHKYEQEEQVYVQKQSELETQLESMKYGFIFLAHHTVAAMTKMTGEQNNAKRTNEMLVRMRGLLLNSLLASNYRCRVVMELLSRSLEQCGSNTDSNLQAFTKTSKFRVIGKAILVCTRMRSILHHKEKVTSRDRIATFFVKSATASDSIPFVLFEDGLELMSSKNGSSVSSRYYDGAMSICKQLATLQEPSAGAVTSASTKQACLTAAAAETIKLFDEIAKANAGAERMIGCNGDEQDSSTNPFGSMSSCVFNGPYSRTMRKSMSREFAGKSQSKEDSFRKYVKAVDKALDYVDNVMESSKAMNNNLKEERCSVLSLTSNIEKMQSKIAALERIENEMKMQLNSSVPVKQLHDLETVIAKLTKTIKKQQNQMETLRGELLQHQKCNSEMQISNESLRDQIVNYQQQQVFFKTEIDSESNRCNKLEQTLQRYNDQMESLEQSNASLNSELNKSKKKCSEEEDLRSRAMEEMKKMKFQMDKQASVGVAQISAIQEAVQIARRAEEEVEKSRTKQELQRQTIESMKAANKKENHRSLLLREELYASRHSIEGLQKRLQLKDVDKASDGIKLASNRALPSTPVSSQKREYLETVRAELNTIRSVAESKLGLLENC